MRTYRSIMAALVITLLAGPMIAAHMRFDKAMPSPDATLTAPPPSIQVWFSEAPDLAVSKLDLTGSSGVVKLTDLHVMDGKSLMAFVADDMPDGVYHLAWQAAGGDGHVQKDTFNFTVKRAASGEINVRP